jgi:hypothetical protein
VGASALAKRHQLHRDLLIIIAVPKRSITSQDADTPIRRPADTLPQLSAKSKPKNWLDEFLAVGYDVPQFRY